jgi:hypothetical protein
VPLTAETHSLIAKSQVVPSITVVPAVETALALHLLLPHEPGQIVADRAVSVVDESGARERAPVKAVVDGHDELVDRDDPVAVDVSLALELGRQAAR